MIREGARGAHGLGRAELVPRIQLIARTRSAARKHVPLIGQRQRIWRTNLATTCRPRGPPRAKPWPSTNEGMLIEGPLGPGCCATLANCENNGSLVQRNRLARANCGLRAPGRPASAQIANQMSTTRANSAPRASRPTGSGVAVWAPNMRDKITNRSAACGCDLSRIASKWCPAPSAQRWPTRAPSAPGGATWDY